MMFSGDSYLKNEIEKGLPTELFEDDFWQKQQKDRSKSDSILEVAELFEECDL